MAPEPRPPVDRVLARVDVHPLGCWEFQGALTERGYGVVQLGRGPGRGTAKAHRVVYEDLVGPIPDGLTLDHLCANPRCVNPAHLEPVTRAENTRRQWRDGRADPGRHQRMKSRCPRGHPYDAENTARYSGRRVCRTCMRDRSRRTRAKETACSP